jgi:selenoprotein W-related protein
LTAKLLGTFKQQLAGVRLIPSKGGCFEVLADGQVLYSKLKTGQFPDEQAIVNDVGQRLRRG